MELWRKNLYTLWTTQFIAMVGMNLVVPFLPFYVRSLGVTDPKELALWSGFAFSGTFVTAFLFTPLWGLLGDRYGRKIMVVRAIFGLALSQVFIGLAQSALQVVLFRLVQGAISGFIASALALVSTSTPRDRIGYAMGLLQSSSAAGMVLGPFIGGVLADLIGYRAIFFVTASLCAVSGVVVTLNVRETFHPVGPEASGSVWQNYRFMATDRRLRLVALGLVIGQMSILMIEPIFALFVESFKSDTKYLATVAGGIFSISGLFMVISAPWWGKRNDAHGYRKSLSLSFMVVGVVYVGHALVTSLVQLGVLRAFLGLARGGILPGLYALTSRYAPADRRGGMMAIASSLTILGNMMGPVIGGFVAGHFGITASFFANSIMLVSLGALFWRYLDVDRPAQPLDAESPVSSQEEV